MIAGHTRSTRPPAHPVYTVDVAHPARSAGSVEQDLETAWQHVRRSKTLRLLKIIHGYGSSGKGGSTRTVVRNWAFAHRQRFRAIIEGERYSLFDPETQQLRRSCGDYPDGDMGAGNPGFLILWIH